MLVALSIFTREARMAPTLVLLTRGTQGPLQAPEASLSRPIRVQLRFGPISTILCPFCLTVAMWASGLPAQFQSYMSPVPDT